MRILLTNDDGIHSVGLKVVYDALRANHDVYVVAPKEKTNAASHSLTLKHPLKIKHLSPHVMYVNGTPTDCVILGVYEVLGAKPDLLISGINMGPNLAEDVSYSGTVGAAIEGGIIGILSFALSFYNEKDPDLEFASIFVQKLVDFVKEKEINTPMVLNINIPNTPKGVKITILGRREYEDVVEKKGRGYLISGIRKNAILPGTDIEACENGYISITPLSIDITNYEIIEKIKFFEQLF